MLNCTSMTSSMIRRDFLVRNNISKKEFSKKIFIINIINVLIILIINILIFLNYLNATVTVSIITTEIQNLYFFQLPCSNNLYHYVNLSNCNSTNDYINNQSLYGNFSCFLSVCTQLFACGLSSLQASCCLEGCAAYGETQPPTITYTHNLEITQHQESIGVLFFSTLSLGQIFKIIFMKISKKTRNNNFILLIVIDFLVGFLGLIGYIFDIFALLQFFGNSVKTLYTLITILLSFFLTFSNGILYKIQNDHSIQYNNAPLL